MQCPSVSVCLQPVLSCKCPGPCGDDALEWGVNSSGLKHLAPVHPGERHACDAEQGTSCQVDQLAAMEYTCDDVGREEAQLGEPN